jgi:hypothetical protein
MSTGFQAPQQFAPQTQVPVPTAGDSRAQQPGEVQMSPNVGQRQGFPTWDASAAMAQRVQQPAQMLPPQQPQQGFQQAPQFPQNNGAGFAPAPQGFNPQQQAPPQYAPQPQQFGQQPPPQPLRPQFTPPQVMPPEQQPGQPLPYQFNDGLDLAGPVGGQQYAPQPQQGPQQFPQQPQQPGQFQAPQGPQQFAPAAPAPIRDRLAAQGVPVGHYQSDEQLLADLGSAAGEIQQLRRYARMGIEAERGIQTQGGQQAAPQGQQPPPANGQPPAAPQRPKAPEWRPEWDSLVKLNPQTGQYQAIDPMAVNPVIVERANEFAAYRRNMLNNLATDPASAVWNGGLSDLVSQEVEKRLQAAEAQRIAAQQESEATRAFDSFIQQNAAQFFQVGQDGQPLVNPYTQEHVLTPRGQAFRQHATRYTAEFTARYGRAPDPRDVLERTQLALVQQDYAAAQQGQQPFQPQQPQQFAGQQPWGAPPQYQPGGQGFNQNQQALENTVQQALARARYVPNANGTENSQAANGVAQNPNLSFRQLLQQAAAQRGLA